jgi:hypothetical protein
MVLTEKAKNCQVITWDITLPSDGRHSWMPPIQVLQTTCRALTLGTPWSWVLSYTKPNFQNVQNWWIGIWNLFVANKLINRILSSSCFQLNLSSPIFFNGIWVPHCFIYLMIAHLKAPLRIPFIPSCTPRPYHYTSYTPKILLFRNQ